MNSSVIANKGFVKTFATKINGKGALYLESPVLVGWSCTQSVGQIIGMTTLPFLSSRYGRKVAMFTYWFILAVSVAVESAARKWHVWLVAKLLAGIGVGCLQSTLPTYIAEVAPVRIRGSLLMCYSFWWTVGSFFAYIALQTMARERPYHWLEPIYTQMGSDRHYAHRISGYPREPSLVRWRKQDRTCQEGVAKDEWKDPRLRR